MTKDELDTLLEKLPDSVTLCDLTAVDFDPLDDADERSMVGLIVDAGKVASFTGGMKVIIVPMPPLLKETP